MNHAIKHLNTNTIQAVASSHPLADVSNYGVQKANKSKLHSFGLSVFAGVFIAIAFVFYLTVTTGSDASSWGLTRLAGGTAFSLGLILVVVCGAELFTSTVLSSVAWAQGKLSTLQLIGCWARVYLGNFVGAMLILLLIFGAKMYQLDGGQWGINALHVAQHKIHHSWLQAFSLGVLCNLLVCLGIWMTFSSKDMLTKSFLLILPVAMFVSSGFEHSIANLFMVPLGIVLQHTVPAEYLISLGYNANSFADLTVSHFVLNNLIPVTLGNIVGGGVMVGLGYWLIYQDVPMSLTNSAPLTNPVPLTTQSITPTSLTHGSTSDLATTTYLPSQGTPIMNNTFLTDLTVAQLMDTKAITFSGQQTATSALLELSAQQARGAVVINEQKELLGFVSEQDLLRNWWANDFELDQQLSVADVMQTEVLSVTPEQSIAELIEFMTVDKSILYPVSDSGVLLSSQYLSYHQRLNKAAAKRPSIYPVIDNGIVVGTITRQHITQHLLLQMQFQEKGVSEVQQKTTSDQAA
ncbi:formate transporter FocA [Psychromonas sp. SR45-3]|uniref:formate transporter FocA n=1 Tax=Psychromonas sp. SR45-3 TaxID=2760930 RepID=UPI0015FA3ADD|nr:formate transporter FocA [Psychromonas sp. SR45-3]MBB1273671.1 formate transporter FocA [Psychromonas sp. SR45-3]